MYRNILEHLIELYDFYFFIKLKPIYLVHVPTNPVQNVPTNPRGIFDICKLTAQKRDNNMPYI